MHRITIADMLKNKKGSVTVMVTLLLIVLIGFAALAIDVGHMMVTRNELQNVADSAALAATRKLALLYEDPAYTALSPADQASYANDHRSEIVSYSTAVTTVSPAVKVAGQSITLSAADFVLGNWDPSATPKFTPTTTSPHAVQVTAQRNAAENGPVATFLAGVVGVGSFNANGIATAAMTCPPSVSPPGLPIPVGISKAWFLNPTVYCDNPIKLYPTNVPGGCAGWHVYDQSPASANMLRDTINGLINGSYSSPETIAGQTQFDFSGGNIANALNNMYTLFNEMRVLNEGEDGILDRDNDSSTWTTTVPVYDWPDCSNPHGSITIVGFATIAITNVTAPPLPQEIDAKVVCNKIIDVPPGSFSCAGTYSSIPNLVQ